MLKKDTERPGDVVPYGGFACQTLREFKYRVVLSLVEADIHSIINLDKGTARCTHHEAASGLTAFQSARLGLDSPADHHAFAGTLHCPFNC